MFLSCPGSSGPGLACHLHFDVCDWCRLGGVGVLCLSAPLPPSRHGLGPWRVWEILWFHTFFIPKPLRAEYKHIVHASEHVSMILLSAGQPHCQTALNFRLGFYIHGTQEEEENQGGYPRCWLSLQILPCSQPFVIGREL